MADPVEVSVLHGPGAERADGSDYPAHRVAIIARVSADTTADCAYPYTGRRNTAQASGQGGWCSGGA